MRVYQVDTLTTRYHALINEARKLGEETNRWVAKLNIEDQEIDYVAVTDMIKQCSAAELIAYRRAEVARRLMNTAVENANRFVGKLAVAEEGPGAMVRFMDFQRICGMRLIKIPGKERGCCVHHGERSVDTLICTTLKRSTELRGISDKRARTAN